MHQLNSYCSRFVVEAVALSLNQILLIVVLGRIVLVSDKPLIDKTVANEIPWL